MDWKKYENEIFEALRTFYPDAHISYNKKIRGKYSKIERQIDVLIEGRIAGKKLRLIMDGKYYSKNIDVKDVECFLGMAKDVEAAQGILMTSKGYSQAAINRAYYDPTDIELDILNFEDLSQHQGFGGQIISGWHGAVIPAPLGWIIDGTKRENCLATLYQRGKSFEEAVQSGEFIYINLTSYDENLKNLESVLRFHEEDTLLFHPTATFEYFDSIERYDGSKTQIRKILRHETHLEEYTGFVSFEEFCVFCVLFTPKELYSKNLRKLEYILEKMLPIAVDLPSFAQTEISIREQRSNVVDSKLEKANILIEIAEIHRDMGELEKAKEKYQESIALFPENYGGRLGLLILEFNSINRDKLIEAFYRVSPGHIQICDDLAQLCIENKEYDLIEKFFKKKAKIHKRDFEKLGCIYLSLAKVNYSRGQNIKALEYFKLADKNFTMCFDDHHPMVNMVREAVIELEN